MGRDGALLLSDFSKGGEGERVAYHRFFRKQQGFKKMVPSAESGGRNAISSGWSSADADTIGHDSAVSDEMDGVVFGDEEQEDGFITIDNQLKSTSIGGSELSGETY